MNAARDSSGYRLLTNIDDVDHEILDEWNAALLYIAQKDHLDYLSVLEDLQADYGEYINVALLVVEDVAGASNDLKREFKSAKLP